MGDWMTEATTIGIIEATLEAYAGIRKEEPEWNAALVLWCAHGLGSSDAEQLTQ